ncbi:MAG: hypothetical protein Q7K28_03310 [Candidatus Wildermuthbacteria bacterium]|nr:hypothetical protein [Candidatus Wildermuthbacteria bacterium]
MPGSKIKKIFLEVFPVIFKDPTYIFLALSSALNLLALYYFFFLQVTTLKVFFDSNTIFYNWASIILTVLIALAFGATISLSLWQWRQQRISVNPSDLGNSLIGSFLGGLSVGCPACGAYLASLLGISGGLFIFPFQGLEIKVVSLGLLIFAIFSSSKFIYNQRHGLCAPAGKEEILKIREGKAVLTFTRETLRPIVPALVGFLSLILVAYAPIIGEKLNFGFVFQQSQSPVKANNSQSLATSSSAILEKINPPQGFEINARYGDIGPKLLAVGAIDFEKMKSLYEQAGASLSADQIKILTEGSNEKIKITPENSYFLLNFFWALGLANKNIILDEGQMVKYGKDKIGNFASTGGWTLGKKDAMDLYSKFEIIKLNSGQQAILDDFANNSYRPCCSNSVAFPDCNHGMAALAFGELMASQGASVDEIFEAYKYLNAFWFPQTYFDVAQYFQAKEGKEWSQVDGRTVAGKDYSTPQGWQRVRQWLSQNGLLEEAPSGGGGCGV